MRALRIATVIALLAFAAGGCASVPLIAAMDVMNVAETGKTGYDMVTGLNSRRALIHDDSPDAQAEARLRAALEAQGGLLRWAVPQVSQGRAYVVGAYSSPEEFERARGMASRVKGVSSVTLCLFRHGSGPATGVTDGELRDNILRMAGLRTRGVRVHVVEGNAVIIGSVRSSEEAEHLRACAREAGATSVRSYLRVASQG